MTSSPSVLVTGGTGFLGRSLVERLLAQGRRVTVLARRPVPEHESRGVRWVQASLEDAEAVGAACEGAGTVFHLAAKVGAWGSQRDFFRANVLGTRALLEACRRRGVERLVYTSTPSVVYNGRDLAGVDESLPLTTRCPSPYPLTKAMAEREVLAAHGPSLRTVALRPHLVFGPGDRHLLPRLLAAARRGRLRRIGRGVNRVDLTYIENAVDAQLLAEKALAEADGPAGGRAYFITNGEPVALWDWIDRLLAALGEPPATGRIPLGVASAAGAAAELAWRLLPLSGEPPMTRFVAAELAKDHWFDIAAARRDLGYVPRVGLAEATERTVAAMKGSPGE